MRSIVICQLYIDLMSTYGDQGNLLYLEYFFRDHGVESSVIRHSYGQPIPPADIYLFGGGQDLSQQLVAADLQSDNGARLRAYLNQSHCLAVCGGYQLLGRSYTLADGKVLPGLGFLPIVTHSSSERMVGPIVIAKEFEGHKRTVIGFENHSGKTFLDEGTTALGQVIKGSGNNGQDKSEGIVWQQTIGTYLHGPILPRNPHLAYWWLKDLLPALELRPTLNWQTERSAHKSYLQEISR